MNNIHIMHIPITSLKVSKSLWYDITKEREQFYHLFSIQIRRKDGICGIQVVVFGLIFIFTTLWLSDLLVRLTNKIPTDPVKNDSVETTIDTVDPMIVFLKEWLTITSLEELIRLQKENSRWCSSIDTHTLINNELSRRTNNA